MLYLLKKLYHPPGTPPGTLVRHEHETHIPLRISLIDYDDASFEEREDVSAADCKLYLTRPTVTWIHAHGNMDLEALRQLADMFELHQLAVEDVLNIGQRPKIEAYDDQFFVIMSLPVTIGDEIHIEQISLFMGENYIVSFHAGLKDPFAPIRERLRKHTGKIRGRGADYLLYALLDVIIDQGFPVLEDYGEEVEELENELLASPGKDTLRHLHKIKRELLLMRRMLWPHREIVSLLSREENDLVKDGTRVFMRDCYDHTIQIMDFLETYRDMTASMLDVYLSSVSNRLNETMRVLTIIATLFIPPTFIVGVYGMNFDRAASPWNMPELGWRYGYPFVWGIIIAITVGMIIFFYRKKWL